MHDKVWADEAKLFDPSIPKSHPWGMTQVIEQNNPVRYVLYLLLVRTHTQFGIKIFKRVCYLNLNLKLFNPPQGPQGLGQKYAVARPIYVSNSHTKFGWILSIGLGADSITDRRTDRIRLLTISTPKSHP